MQSRDYDSTGNQYISDWKWQTVRRMILFPKAIELYSVHILIFAFHCIHSSRILCDTGECEKPDYIKHLKKVLSDEKATISDIILTHWHYDHIGGVKDVFQSLDIGNGSVQNSKSFVFI